MNDHPSRVRTWLRTKTLLTLQCGLMMALSLSSQVLAANAEPSKAICQMPAYQAEYQFSGAVEGDIHQSFSTPSTTTYEFTSETKAHRYFFHESLSEQVEGQWIQQQFEPTEYRNRSNHLSIDFAENEGKINISHNGLHVLSLVYQPSALDSLTMPLALQHALIENPKLTTITLPVVVLMSHRRAAVLPIEFRRGDQTEVVTPFGRLRVIELTTQYLIDEHTIAAQYWFAPSLHGVLVKSATQVDGKSVAVALLVHYKPATRCLGE